MTMTETRHPTPELDAIAAKRRESSQPDHPVPLPMPATTLFGTRQHGLPRWRYGQTGSPVTNGLRRIVGAIAAARLPEPLVDPSRPRSVPTHESAVALAARMRRRDDPNP